ncbi:hypothetical protein V1508DRAFT_431563 [Lipomyces doorenjongii]|uniref:uncharacterized protein n=1 Tax=Lipomyces doorenjongii TaxID=383834 RepID=UPI0034CDD7DB
MRNANEFVDCVLSAAFVKLVSTPMSVTKDVLDKLKQIQSNDLPVPYAARTFSASFGTCALEYRTDGLFGVWNSIMRADMSKLFHKVDEWNGYRTTSTSEVRWQVYVARAVERYARWFNSLPAAELDIRLKFLGGIPCSIDIGTLPPIDVLMIWHVHLLHPRAYWEDCIRSNRQGVFKSMAVPWLDIVKLSNRLKSHVMKYNGDITDSELIYDPPSDAKKHFRRPQTAVSTTKTTIRDIQVDFHAAFHHGWAEEQFEKYCPECGAIIARDSLSALQFLDDFSLLSSKGIPMKGTLLDYLGVDDREQCSYPGFANEVLGELFSMPKLTLASGEGMDAIRGKLKDMLGDKAKMM